MRGDALASGAKSANFGPANSTITQAKWDEAFKDVKIEEKKDERRKRNNESNS